MKDCLLKSRDSGSAPIIMTNTSLSTQVLKRGTYLEKAVTVDLIHADTDANRADVEERMKPELSVLKNQTYSNVRVCWRKQELRKQLQSFPTTSAVPKEQMQQLYDTLEEYHTSFRLMMMSMEKPIW